MFSKLANTFKDVLKAIKVKTKPFTLKSYKYALKSLRFLESCFSAFGRSVKGYVALVARFFKEIKQNGLKTALCAHFANLREARRNHAPLLSKCAVVAVPLAFMVLVGITSPVWANFTFAKRVVYAKNVLGEVLDAAICKTAEDYFIKSVVSDDAETYLEEYSLKTVYVMKKHVLSAETLAVQMLKNTETLVNGYGLYVDDQLSIVSKNVEPLHTNLSAVLEQSKNGNENAEVAFIQSVEVKEGYYPAEEAVEDTAVSDAFAQNQMELSVKTTVVEEYDESVAYKTEETKSAKLAAGKTQVVTKGINGKNHITAHVTYIDGVEVERVVTDTQVISEPVTKQVLVGTKKAATVQSNKVMLWPIPKSTRYVITGEFNEDRTNHNHKGLDIACDKGTPIYAVMAGTVTSVQSTGSYGKHLTIDHGNNVVTLYAHCSAILVSQGDRVAKGEHIAAVGSTGRSTGNHLHLEVRVNGKVYNPMNYLDK